MSKYMELLPKCLDAFEVDCDFDGKYFVAVYNIDGYVLRCQGNVPYYTELYWFDIMNREYGSITVRVNAPVTKKDVTAIRIIIKEMKKIKRIINECI